MKRLTEDVIQFFQNQGCVIVSTIDRDKNVHNACKGIVRIDRSGLVYLLDLYKARTYENLKRNPHISITAINEHKFMGYCFKGRAKIITIEKLPPQIIRAWESKITSRLTQRLLKNIREERGHRHHPEILLPKPEYMIAMEVEEVIDLTPQQLK